MRKLFKSKILSSEAESYKTLSLREQKLVALTSRVGFSLVFVSLLYLCVDQINGVYGSWPFQIGASLLFFIGYKINQRGQYFFARTLLILTGNLTVFYFVLVEPLEIGMCFFYIICYIGSLVCFGFEKKRNVIFFVVLTTILSILSVMVDIPILPKKNYSLEFIRITLIINLIVVSFTSILMVYFLISVNYYSEVSLKENEKAISEKNEALIKANKELDRFVYSSSHDLRSPISSVRGLINVIKLSNDPTEIKGYLEMMEKRLIHLDKFIGDISNYSRNARLSLRLTEITLREFIINLIEGLKFYPGKENIEITIDIDPNLSITTDVTRLEIVLGNILSNAFKYADDTKPTQWIKVTTLKIASDVVIEIQDNGVGIPQEHVPKIFDMFFQAHEKTEGSGLGLYIVKETLENLNGTIQVTTALGKGCLFKVMLPTEYSQKDKALKSPVSSEEIS